MRKSRSGVAVGWRLALGCVSLLMAAGVVGAAVRGLPVGETLTVVRVDLEGGTFLDPLPFDRPFLLAGRVPAGTETVEIRLSEWLEAPVIPSEPQVQRFEAKLTAYLEHTLAGNSLAAEVDLQRLRLKIDELLLEAVQLRGVWHSLGQIWRYAPPWNWKNWGDRFQERRSTVVAPGTLFDLDSAEGGVALKGLLEAPSTTPRSLARRMAEEARAVEVVVFSPSRAVRPVVRWTRLEAAGEGAMSGPGLAAEAVGTWNRLERIGALTGTSVLDKSLFIGAAGPTLAGRGKEEGWPSFRGEIPPLEAGRYYRFAFRLERKLAESEVTAFVERAGRRADEVLAEAAGRAFSPADGQRLHGALSATLQGVIGRGWRAAPGTLLDPETAYASVHPAMIGLAEEGRRAAEGGQAAALAGSLEELIRGQPLVHETRWGASTAANDYVSGDVGLLHAGVIGQTVAYVGVNFYPRPVDKGVPLRRQGGLGRRFAWTAGLTLHSIEDRRGIRSDLYVNQALVVGAGYRISQYWRLGGGGLVFRERIPETFPLTGRRRLALTPYVSLSFDADVGQPLSGVGRLFDFLKGGN